MKCHHKTRPSGHIIPASLNTNIEKISIYIKQYTVQYFRYGKIRGREGGMAYRGFVI